MLNYINKWWVEGAIMDWTWHSPVALGFFLLLVGGALVLMAVAVAVVSGKAKVSDLPVFGLWRR